jgi:geranylgeranyl diphosphate synthase type II
MKIVSPLKELQDQIRAQLEDCLIGAFSSCQDSEICRVAKYALLGGGHRWRGLVVVAVGRIFAHKVPEKFLPLGAAFEMAHAASLILDDLPSMDDARIRRGKPCAHLVFPTWAVDMAPAFLVALANHLLLNDSPVPLACRTSAAIELNRAGLQMASGQELDLLQPSEQDDEQRLLRTYRLKTGVLFAAAAKAAALLCAADEATASKFYECGMNLGLVYQLLDDVADAETPMEVMGKCQGMDAKKRTSIQLFGVDGAKSLANELKEKSKSQLTEFGSEANFLRELIADAHLGIF